MESIFWIYGLGVLIWIYSFISVLSNDFKKDSTKIAWILALIFIPISCVLYPFLKDRQIEIN